MSNPFKAGDVLKVKNTRDGCDQWPLIPGTILTVTKADDEYVWWNDEDGEEKGGFYATRFELVTPASFAVGDKVEILRGKFIGQVGTISEPRSGDLDDAIRFVVAIENGPQHLQYVASSLKKLPTFIAGDWVKILAPGPYMSVAESSIGSVLQVVDVYDDLYNKKTHVTLTNDYYYFPENLEAAESPVKIKPKKGDKVRVISGYDRGSEFILVDDADYDGDHCMDDVDAYLDTSYIHYSNLEVVTSAEDLKAQPKAGDRVRVISDADGYAHDQGKEFILNHGPDGDDEIYTSGHGIYFDAAYIHIDNLEVIETAEEIAEKGTFKLGDRVRILCNAPGVDRKKSNVGGGGTVKADNFAHYYIDLDNGESFFFYKKDVAPLVFAQGDTVKVIAKANGLSEIESQIGSILTVSEVSPTYSGTVNYLLSNSWWYTDTMLTPAVKVVGPTTVTVPANLADEPWGIYDLRDELSAALSNGEKLHLARLLLNDVEATEG